MSRKSDVREDMKTALAERFFPLLVGIVIGSVSGGSEAVRTGSIALDAVSKLMDRLKKDTANDWLESE